MSKESMIKRDIQSDIDKIKGVLQSNSSIQELTNIHMYIDGKYQSKISNWGLSQYSWNDKLGFDYEFLGEDSLKHNLNNMKNKLEGYLQDYRLLPLASSSSPAIKFINNNTNNNEIKVEIDFTNLINKINDMESLTETETNEAIEKVKEIEKIYKSKDSKKKKWEKIKNILIWLADKSVDLAIAYLPIITNSLN